MKVLTLSYIILKNEIPKELEKAATRSVQYNVLGVLNVEIN